MSWTKARSNVANTIRLHPDDAEAIAEARRLLKAARAEDYIRKLVDESPPLTDAIRDRLALILRGGAA